MTRFLWLLSTFVFLGLAAPSGAFAQDDGIDYPAWGELAVRAEGVLEAGRASDSALETLRLELVGWRQAFQVARGANAPRLETLQAQLDSLGPVPEDGQSEAADVAARRAELSGQIAELLAPTQRAEEAYTRADGIISEIDAVIRERQTDALLTLGPSPLNPTHWGGAWRDLTGSIRSLWSETSGNITTSTNRATAQSNLPLILVFLAAGLLMLHRGPRWTRWAVVILRHQLGRWNFAWRFLMSLLSVALPVVAVFLITQAISLTGMVGPRLVPVLAVIPQLALIFFGVRWLAEQAFDVDDDVAALPLAPDSRAEARTYASWLSGLYIANLFLSKLTQFDMIDAASTAVIGFPLLVLSGLVLFRLGQVRNSAALPGQVSTPEDAPHFSLRVAQLLGQGGMIVGVLGPVLAAIGYARVGNGLVYPFIETLALICAVIVVQNFLNGLYSMVSSATGRSSSGLLPVLAGFAVALAALPLLALIWGARVADLTELWATLREGFVLGETRISPTDFLVVLLVFVIGYMLTRILQGALRSSVLPRTKLDRGGQNAVVSGVGYVGIFLAAMIAISAGGIDLSSLALVAGALSVGIGFGLQNIVSNFVSGIILLIERPISQGDWIEVGGVHGTVTDISVRSTRLETFDRYEVIIPNADLVSGQVSNYTRANQLGRIIVPVGVAYGNDTRRIESLLLNIARQHDMVLMKPAPYVVFKGFGADSLDFEIRAVLRDVNFSLSTRTEINHRIAECFAAEGIEIPFAQRDIWLRNPEALGPGGNETS